MESNDQVILKEVLRQKREELTDPLDESVFFELFAAEQITKDYDLSYEEIESGIVAGGNDGGIDGLFFFVNGELIREDTDLGTFHRDVKLELYVIQAKSTSGFSDKAIQSLRSTSEELLDLSRDLTSLQEAYNSQLVSIISKFREAIHGSASRFPTLRIAYYYATLGDHIHPNVQRQVAPLRELIGRLFTGAEFSFEFLGARDLLELTRRRPRSAYKLRLSDSPIATEDNAYVCLVTLSDYNDFITDGQTYARPLFDANVRDHQGNVQVNRGIRDTLSKPQGEDFWWLNNGVTVLAAQAQLAGKLLSLENPRIVNGLQTSIEIFRHFAESTHDSGLEDETRRILVRVIVPTEQDSYERIIKATNSQTSIPVASLRATDRVHRNIEDYFKGKGLYYDRRKNQYKNEGKPRDRIVSITYVAQAVMSVVLGRPNDARARPSTLLKDDEGYEQVFNDKYAPSVYLVATQMVRHAESHLRAAHIPLDRKDVRNLRFYVAMFTARVILNDPNPNPSVVADLDMNELDTDAFAVAIEEVVSVFRDLGGDDQVAKGSEMLSLVKERINALTFKIDTQ